MMSLYFPEALLLTVNEMFVVWSVVVGLICLCGCTFIMSSMQCFIVTHASTKNRRPPLVPYFFPFVGNTVGFARNIGEFLSQTVKTFGYSTPATISLIGGEQIHLVSNADYIAAMLSLKTSRTLTMKNSVLLAMSSVFGAPKHIIRIWEADNSGINTVPLTGSTVKNHNRVFMNSHKSSLKYLSGSHLRFLSKKFISNFKNRLQTREELQVTDGTVIPDLYAFLQHEMFNAVVESLCGQHMLRLNPTLAEDFWNFESATPSLFKGLPRFLNPKGYAARDRMLDNIKNWHAFVKSHCEPSSIDDGSDEDEYYGTKWMKKRAMDHSMVDKFDADGCAADDLGLLFGANGNAIPATFWLLYYILITPNLLGRVRIEIFKCQHRSDEDLLAILIANPLLSSIFAETLRLRNASLVTRTPIEDSYTMGPWRFRRGDLIGMSNWITCRNPDLWNTRPSSSDSLDEFYAERFLIDPTIPGSGTNLHSHVNVDERNGKKLLEQDTEVRFSLEGLAGGFIPWGGGSSICPGRHFAKMEILGAMSVLLGRYDIELIGTPKVEPDMSFMLLGMLPPRTKVAARVKLRKEAVSP